MSLTYSKPDISGNLHSVSVAALMETKTDNYTVLASDNGKTFCIATASKVFTLPPTQNGLRYRFVNTGAATNNTVRIAPNAADKIIGTFTLAASIVKLPGVDNKYIDNTAGTSVKGDWVELTGDGVDGWYITGSDGIWAVQG